MGTRLENLSFNYDGVSSEQFDIIHVALDSGMYEESFVANREIIEERVKGRAKPYFQGITEEPLEFDLIFAFNHVYDEYMIRNIINWLYQDYYKPLYFSNDPSRVYYCMPVNESSIVHNGLKQGYVKITMRCDSPYVYSNTFITNQYKVINSKEIFIENKGDFDMSLEISIKKDGDGVISIENMDNGKIFQIRNLIDNEDIYINTEREIIETELIGVYHYEDIDGDMPKLRYGLNKLKIVGNCDIQFKYYWTYRF